MKKQHPNIKKILISSDALRVKVTQLGTQITADYANKQLTLLGVLKGSLLFLADLSRAISLDCHIDLLNISSYKGKERGKIKTYNQKLNIKGRDILIVEDIVDSGQTIHYLTDLLLKQKPSSLEVCTLLDKPECRKINITSPKYIGFKIPNEFVVGYGLDYNQEYRNLPYIGILRENKI